MSNLTVNRQGPEVQLDRELDYHEKMGRSFVEADPWRPSQRTQAKEIVALGLVLGVVWIIVLLVLMGIRGYFCYYGCGATYEGMAANGLWWLWLSAPVIGLTAWAGVAIFNVLNRSRAEAARMSVTRDRYGNPVGAGLVLAKSYEQAAAELALATRAEVEMAPHKIYRGIDSLSVSYNSAAGKGPAAAELMLAEDAPNVGPLSVAEWNALIDKAPHVMLAAKTGGGKSTMARFILRPRLENEELLFIIDPHWAPSNWNGLPGVGAGEDWGAIAVAFDQIVEEYHRRLAEFSAGKATSEFTRLTVLVDEVAITKLAFDKSGKQNAWTRFVSVLGSGARKVRVSVVLMTQSTNVADLGVSGPLRENYTRIALDARTIRQLIEDDGSKERREALYATLPSQGDFPAATEVNGEVFFLDRSNIVEVTFPGRAFDCIWEPAASSQGVETQPLGRSVGPEKSLLEGLLTNFEPTDPTTDRDPTFEFLVECAMVGMKRDAAFDAARAAGHTISGGKYRWGEIVAEADSRLS